MSYHTISLPTLTQTTSQTETSAEWLDLMDAAGVAFNINGVTTAPGIQLQITFTTSSGSTFYHYRFPSSGATTIYCTSSGMYTVSPFIGKGARFASSNVLSTSFTVTGVKQIVI